MLASLQENEQHRDEGENQSTINKMWQGMKTAWKETCEETLGRERKQHKTFLSLDTLKKIEARKKMKKTLNRIRNDRRHFVEDLARHLEKAPGRGDAKELYSITRKLEGDRKIPDRPVRTKSGDLLTGQEE